MLALEFVAEGIVFQVIYIFIILLEIFGAVVIVYSSSSVFYYFLRTSRDGHEVRMNLARFLSFGLEFFLGAEILRTVVSRDLEEIKVLAAIIALRSIMTVLIHWELKQ